MNEALISIGSNWDKEQNIAFCQQKLSKLFPHIQTSIILETKPCGKQYSSDFLNQIFLVKTEQSYDEVYASLKEIERLVGRTSNDKSKGIIKIDIDLIKWNSEVLKQSDMEREYMKTLIDSIDKLS